MARMEFLLGESQSGKTERCLAAYAGALQAARANQQSPRILWLTPARESRQEVLTRLLSLTDGVVFQPNVLTFERFAARVLGEAEHAGQYITAADRRLILRSLIRESRARNEFQYYQGLAETEGFVDVLAGFVTELKRAEIWPETFLDACRQRFRADMHRHQELGQIYHRYQAILLEKNWYDAEGRFWLARTEMQKSRHGFWHDLSLVVVDGFSDFTRTQQEMLEQLAVHAQSLLVTLPLEQPVVRPELFAKPLHVLGELQQKFQRHGSVKLVACDAHPPATPAGMTQIRRRLFGNPREITRATSSAGVTLLAAWGDRSERDAVAWEIKRLLAKGVSPETIVVGLRSVTNSGRAWADHLTAAGIPVFCEAALPWSRSPFLKTLFALLQLELEDWPFDRLLGVLNSGLFRPISVSLKWNPASSPQHVSRSLRRLQLHSHRLSILKTLRRRAERPPAGEEAAETNAIRFADRVLHELSAAGDVVRKSHTLDEWADVLAAWTRRLGLWIADDETSAADAERLQGVLRFSARIEAALSEEPPRRSLAELLIILRDLVQLPAPHAADSPRGRVRIVGADTLRHLQPAYLFVAELTEDSFPARRTEDCLYSELERQQFHSDGLQFSHQELHQREEMLLFYLAVTRATKSLTLSYSQVNASGHENYPSPYVTALCDLFEPALKETEVGSLDPLPDKLRSMSAADLRLEAVRSARNDKRAGWWQLLLQRESPRGPLRNVLAAAETAALRFHTPGFTTHEGVLKHPRHLEELARRFSPQHQFSATELESYAGCPFQFWLANVLNLEPLPSPEVVTDHLRRGTLVHDVLAAMEQEITDPNAEIAKRFRELVTQRLERVITEDELQQALLTVEQRLLSKWGDAFSDQHATYLGKATEKQWVDRETLHEVPFGTARDADAEDPRQRFPALVLGTGDAAIRLGGRIDRIDIAVAEESRVFTLIDYKSGRRPDFSIERLAKGESLQLALYTLAVLRLGIAGENASPFWIGYWSLKETGFAPAGTKRNTAWNPLEHSILAALDKLLMELVPKLVAGMRTGEFVVDSLDPDCTNFCAYHTVCRVNQIRPLADRLEKRREPLVQLPDQPS